MFLFSLVVLICSFIVFVLNRKHLLLLLLSLEFIVLSLYFNIYMLLLYFDYEFYILMIFLVMSICEGVLGLAILISLIRTHGNDYIKTFSLLW
uniref:NADH-ubiquinone oxidoreductase chain 4L n=1 Tax=Lucifotychus sp. 1 EF-2015 TaxID=1756870 RepID=A0A0S2M7K8_9COLE|nr:NADH deshydrogenase subunit 4L [Lucifotychus sp. 1 EF-2015]